MISRRRSREFLLQLLYARHTLGTSFLQSDFEEAYFSEDPLDGYLDRPYVSHLDTAIRTHQSELLGLITSLAPKFELDTMPVIHLLILMIALAEFRHLAPLDTIPGPVIMNEAIELAKRFSDEQGKVFVNGALSTYLKNPSDAIVSPSSFTLFS